MFNLGRSLPQTKAGPLGTGGGSVTITEAVGLRGDSMAADASAGGSPDAYQATKQWLMRAFTAANVPLTVANESFPGETGAQILTRWRARTVYYRYTYIAMGRNSSGTGPGLGDPGAVAALQAQFQEIIDTAKPGENLLFETIHNYNDSTGTAAFQGEKTGGAHQSTYDNIVSLNNWLASKADGAKVVLVDTRSTLVLAYNQNNSTDQADAAGDQPPRSLTSDGLHRNAQGTEVKCRQAFAAIYSLWLVANPRSNLVTNGDFSGGTSTGWTAGGSTTLTVSSGRLNISGAGTFKSAGQQVLGSGANGKRYLLMWDYPTYNGNIAAKSRPFTGGGSDYASPAGWGSQFSGAPLPYNPGDSRAGHKFLTFISATQDQLAVLFEAQNDASALWSVDYVVVHQVA